MSAISIRDLRLQLEWLLGRIKWELSEGTPLRLGGHSMPFWRWKIQREFYRKQRRRGSLPAEEQEEPSG